ncbi:MAG: DDE-type integrase/transposase/recombinase [Actinobacteria bacterium]|nr:DDE-type integrase/transposase/recombinase [Actinomycetota bacterium]
MVISGCRGGCVSAGTTTAADDVLLAIPNVSEGRDEQAIAAIGDAFCATGARLLDVHSDPDHHRTVFTLAGDTEQLVSALVAGAHACREHNDLGQERGSHPHVGALDVAPLVALTPEDVPWGEPAYVLIGALSHSGRFRGVFCEQMTFGHLAEAMHRVLVALGGTPRVWRTDRMATIVVPGSDRLTVDAAQAAKHYGVQVAVCPARRAQRKGVVEAAIKYTTRSWWRSARVATIAESQA